MRRYNSNFQSNFQTRRSSIKGLFILVAVLIVVGGLIKLFNQTNIREVNNAKVMRLSEQQLINEKNTEYRFIIVTDKGTFISESSIVNNKFDNSNIYYSLKEGNTYNFKVAGADKSMFFDYPNIISYNEVTK